MDLGLDNRIAIVTGAAGGIGLAIARTFAANGATVMLCDIDEERVAESAKSIRDAGGAAVSARCDVSSTAEAEAVVATCRDQFGRVDILVNNAGFTRDMRITKMRNEDWDAVLDVVLKGAFICTRAVVPAMTDARWGRIVNISSRAHLGNAGQANYSAAKAGLLGLTRAMALEHGRNGITVNAVAPGIIATQAVTNLPHYEKIRDAAEKTTPIRRIGVVEDVADAVVFLASDRASYISGEVLHVTGGRY